MGKLGDIVVFDLGIEELPHPTSSKMFYVIQTITFTWSSDLDSEIMTRYRSVAHPCVIALLCAPGPQSAHLRAATTNASVEQIKQLGLNLQFQGRNGSLYIEVDGQRVYPIPERTEALNMPVCPAGTVATEEGPHCGQCSTGYLLV